MLRVIRQSFCFIFIFYSVQIGSAAQIYRNSTGHVIGYAGIFWEQLNWHARQSNFRSLLLYLYVDMYYEETTFQ